MPLYLADANLDVTSVAGVLEFVKSLFIAILTAVGSIYTTITSTPILAVVIYLGLAGAFIMFAVKILNRLGIGGGRRRRRARR